MSETGKSQPRSGRDAHHILLFASALSAAILVVVISVATLRIETVCLDGRVVPNKAPSSICEFERQTSYSWPFKQVDGEAYWPLITNYLLFVGLIYGMARAEARIKGHWHASSK